VGAAMREVHDAYPLALPMHNPDADAHSRVVPNNLHIDDRLETYSLQMWSYMWEYRRWSGDFVYANGHYELKYFPGFNNPEIEHEINIIDRGFVTSPFSKICSSKGRIFKINGISDNDKIIKDGFDPPYTPGAADDRWPVDANPGGK